MADRPIKLRRLRRILARHGVQCSPARGKGSHMMFHTVLDGRTFTYPVPDQTDVKVCYVRGCRKKFRLTAEDGVTDADFYGK